MRHLLINFSINEDMKEDAKSLSMTDIEYLDFKSNFSKPMEIYNKSYKGARVDTTLIKIGIPEENLNYKVESHDFIWNIEGLSMESQSLVIKLKKVK